MNIDDYLPGVPGLTVNLPESLPPSGYIVVPIVGEMGQRILAAIQKVMAKDEKAPKKASCSQRVVTFMAEYKGNEFTAQELYKATNLRQGNLQVTLRTRHVKQAMDTYGWRHVPGEWLKAPSRFVRVTPGKQSKGAANA
ncbi:hypothetical protein [Methylovirgula sp. 4M-Z18]|uniref:hypothetical protein n=1 Tax=Methylovirgula sp. 4M-Z18 TaxID=2293567 RepID=UPI000E2ED0CC|nr:hypothetical protein [Methylovirgula sp. 4M-Z18]RFB78314.1 hypothetical protein DYH55_16320 [Methylovirgula sp. 4M-Z18]